METPNSLRSKKIMKGRRIIIPAILIPLALFSACGRQLQSLKSMFPKNIEELQLEKIVTGTKALAQINKLHGKEITVEEGAIGTYQTDNESPAMVWISRSKTAGLARHQTEVMIDRMLSVPHSPFHHPAQQELQGINVCQFQGMGQIHYIFCRHDLVYWISAAPGQGDKVLQAFLPG